MVRVVGTASVTAGTDARDRALVAAACNGEPFSFFGGMVREMQERGTTRHTVNNERENFAGGTTHQERVPSRDPAR